MPPSNSCIAIPSWRFTQPEYAKDGLHGEPGVFPQDHRAIHNCLGHKQHSNRTYNNTNNDNNNNNNNNNNNHDNNNNNNNKQQQKVSILFSPTPKTCPWYFCWWNVSVNCWPLNRGDATHRLHSWIGCRTAMSWDAHSILELQKNVGFVTQKKSGRLEFLEKYRSHGVYTSPPPKKKNIVM